MPRSTTLPLALDLIERCLLVFFYGWLVYRAWPTGGDPGIIRSLLLISEAMTVAFIISRRFATNISLRPQDWLVAVVGTIMPLLIVPTDAHPDIPYIAPICALIMIVGMVVQISAKLALRRSFGIVAANRGIKVGGPYRFIRHPMYAGYIVTNIGFWLYNPSLWNAAVYLTGLVFQVARILAEERVLLQDVTYRAFAERTRYRLLFRVF